MRMDFLLIVVPCAILEVFMKVKLHCTNCQSLARLSPVFSALRSCVPDLARRSLIATLSPGGLLSPNSGDALIVPHSYVLTVLRNNPSQYPSRPTLDRTLITPYKQIRRVHYIRFAGRPFNTFTSTLLRHRDPVSTLI